MDTTHNKKEENTDTFNNIGDYQNIVLSGRSQKQRKLCRFSAYTVLEQVKLTNDNKKQICVCL